MNSSELVSPDAVWLGCFEYNSSCFICCHGLIRSSSLITSLIYPCHSAGGTVRAFTLAGLFPPRLNMPSADSHCVINAPCGLLTRLGHPSPRLLFCVPSPFWIRLINGLDAPPTDAGIFFLPVFPDIPVACSDGFPPRRNGSPGVSSDCFQRTIVRYTWFGHVTDRGLCPVLRTRPGLTPPQICLPSTLSDTGHTCTSTRAFASGFLQAYITVPPLPLATLRLRQPGSGL